MSFDDRLGENSGDTGKDSQEDDVRQYTPRGSGDQHRIWEEGAGTSSLASEHKLPELCKFRFLKTARHKEKPVLQSVLGGGQRSTVKFAVFVEAYEESFTKPRGC